ncbi:hypothetical protein ZWY2020_056150 [Hordeum vulgare]|nr:hypothetical protein ZWY2020_056150 [Hordeum vulgare]
MQIPAMDYAAEQYHAMGRRRRRDEVGEARHSQVRQWRRKKDRRKEGTEERTDLFLLPVLLAEAPQFSLLRVPARLDQKTWRIAGGSGAGENGIAASLRTQRIPEMQYKKGLRGRWRRLKYTVRA